MTEYGIKIAAALKAIVQMHSDTSRLLVDCDKHIGKGRPSVFGSYATRDLTYSYKASFWMAEGVYRYYPSGPNVMDGITVVYHSALPSTDPRSETEPMLLVGRIQYSSASIVNPSESGALKGKCDEWDLWNLYFAWCKRECGKVVECQLVDNGRIEWGRLIAVPLFSVDNIEVVVRLVDEVAAASPDRGSAIGITE
jgi:hypothetical protein